MNDSPLLVSCPIVENRQITPGYFLIKFSSQELAAGVVPGQFFNIRVADRLDIILRWPFSVFDTDNVHVSILYEVVGKGTRELSKKQPGQQLDVLGPLGKGFSLDPLTKKAIIIGGGMGIAPLHAWVKELVALKDADRDLEIEILIGGKSKYQILCEQEFKNMDLNPEIATDDGSYGFHGLVTDLLLERSMKDEVRDTKIYACGPNNMLRAIAKILNQKNIPGELSLDRHMACGLGVCLGCVVKVKADIPQGYVYRRVCKDGPVFNANEVLL